MPSLFGFSPSDYIISSEQLARDLQMAPDGEQTVDLLGDASWREAGVFFSKALGFPAEPVQGGFEVVEGFDRVAAEGVARQVLLGSGSSGNASEEDRRIPLGVAEQRGFSSPERGSGQRKEISDGDDGSKEGGGGLVKRWRKSWIKVKQVKNYAVGEDIAWGCVLQMAKFTLVGRVMGRNFSRKMVAGWVEENWKPLMGYAPVVVMLNRGWFTFKFIKEEELRWVLNMN